MRKTCWIMIILVMALPAFCKDISASANEHNELTISFRLPEYELSKETPSATENKIKVLSTDEEWLENMSGLPQYTKWVYVPAGYKPVVTVASQVFESRQNCVIRTEEKTAIDDEWIDISQPMVLRGNRIFSICFRPFQYDEINRELKIMKMSDIKVSFEPDAPYEPESRFFSATTTNILQNMCVNRNSVRLPSQQHGSYVIVYNGANITSYIEPLASWKRQKGYNVRMVNTVDIGNTTTAIKNYLQTAYDTWENPPEFILILGRPVSSNNFVPAYVESYTYSTYGDYRYTLLDGTDLIPDAYIGRLTFASTDELQTAINKILHYEKMQNLSTTDWLNKTFLLGDPYDSGQSCITTMLYIKSLNQSYNPSAQFTEAYSGTFPPQISTALNGGVGTYWYRGHGDLSGWTLTNISNLNNSGKYPFISYITCFSGNMGSSSSMSQSEKFMRVGTPTAPKGAIGVIGASVETHTCLNNIVTGGVAYGLYNEGITQCGPAMVRGKLALMANYPQNPANYINQYMQQINLFGDPALDIWLQSVTDISVTGPTQLNNTGGTVSVRVTVSDGTPLEGAWVCLSKGTDELQISGFTNENGLLVLSYYPVSVGTAVLTVTKPNYKTRQFNVNVINSPQEISLAVNSTILQIASGSTVTFPISIANNTTDPLINVTGTLQTEDEYITITQNLAQFGNVTAGSNAASQSNYTIQVSPYCPKGKRFYFNLHLSYNSGIYNLPFTYAENGPNIIATAVQFSNNQLVHGTNQLSISLFNESIVPVTGIQLYLESNHPLLTVTNPVQNITGINANASISIPTPYILNVANTLFDGVEIRLNLHLSNDNDFMQTITIDKTVGTPSSNDVTGPDYYGYICYGPGDTMSNTYNWIELDPTYGGSGINLNLTDTNTEGSGSFSTITIPFQFRFYGKTYGQLTVCSNGFLMPGTQGSIEWMNWQIPGPMVPKPIIAPFWDDLLTDNLSKVLHKYDNNLHAVIVQWQSMKNKYSPSLRETFQAILYDPVYYSTPTGDSPILFQYKVFNNVDAGNYGTSTIDHGQYVSIGIGDHTGTVGLSYTFNNQYPPTAQPLTNFSTLYLTTLPNYQLEANPIILNYTLDDSAGNNNGQPDAGEMIYLSIAIKNIGLGFLSESQVMLSSTDSNLALFQNLATLPSLFHSQTAYTSVPFSFMISPNCPNNYILHLSLLVSNSQEQFSIPLELNIHALQFDYSNFLITDSNNNFPEPGETIQLSFAINSLSLLPGNNILVTMLHPDIVVVNPVSQNVSIAPMASVNLTFQMLLNNSISQGSEVSIQLNLQNSQGFNTILPISFFVGVPMVVLDTDFDNTTIEAVFPGHFYAYINPAQYIHSTGSEVLMTFTTNYLWSYLITDVFNVSDLLTARIEFTYHNLNPEASLSVQVLYANQSTMQTIWQTSEQTLTPQNVVLYLYDIPTTAEFVCFAFLANKNGIDSSPIALDDFKLHFLRHNPGFIAGHVLLDLNPELVSQVSLRLRFDPNTYHPDDNGNFLIPAYQGQNVLFAFLDGFICTPDSLVINVISEQTSTSGVFSFQKLRAPLHLTHYVQGNELTLNWDLEGDILGSPKEKVLQREDRLLVPDYYRIWFRCNLLNFQDTSPTQTYTRFLSLQGDYQISVRAVYLFGGLEEHYSDLSNTIEFNYTHNEDNLSLQYVFALNQNSPNPFVQSTRISFTLPDKQFTLLNIYNLKGQLVRKLVSNELDKGEHSIVWNGRDNYDKMVSPGVYYYKLIGNNKKQIRKMVLLR